jgi:hypothetical protein
LINATVTDVARKLGVSEETIEGLLDRWSERAVEWEAWERLGVLGLDEIALKRGHRDFVTLVTAPLEGGGVEILAVLADRKKETVAAFLRVIPMPLRRPIERACTEMYEGFVNAITDGCDCMRKPKEQEKPVDEALAEAVARGKRERQAVLKRVRRQRALIMKRSAAKSNR